MITQEEAWEILVATGTPVLLRDLNLTLQKLEGNKDPETVMGYYLPEEKQYIQD